VLSAIKDLSTLALLTISVKFPHQLWFGNRAQHV